MALTANTVWEVRTTGSDTNGGAFDATIANHATLAVPTANTIPSAAATVPDAPGALDASGYYIDADNATDGVNASYLRP